MKVYLPVSLLISVLIVPSLSAKLDQISRQIQGYRFDAPVAPAIPSGLYELPGPPPPPIIPTRQPVPRTTPKRTTPRTTTLRRTTPRRTTPRRTTTTTPVPPPPPGLYETPDFSLSGDAANAANRFANFVTPKEPLPTPEIPKKQFTEASRPTPSGFTPPTPMMNKMNMPYMPYEIDFGVQDAESGNQYSHSEISEGNDVRGEYRVLMPDGRTQVVTFFASPETGYNAEVTYV